MGVRGEGNQLSLLDPPRLPDDRAAVREHAARGTVSRRVAGSSDEGIAALEWSAQPELPFGIGSRAAADEHARIALERRLRAAMGHDRVLVAVTDNRRTMVSIRKRGDHHHVRLHHMFLAATPEVVTALGRYFSRGDRYASRLIDRFIAANQDRIKSGNPRSTQQFEPVGTVHDLAEILRSLSERYFDGRVEIPITWGRHARTQRRRHSRRTIRMGTYLIDEKIIRIHPALDQSFVPRYFVEWVVYHEMLHHVIPMPVVNGRRVYHSDEFRARECLYEEYERAKSWEETHLSRLISSRRSASTTVRVLPY
jgi:hypothetical protein